MKEDKKRPLMEDEDGFLNGMADGLPEDAVSPPEEQGTENQETREAVRQSQARQLEARRRAEVREFLAVFPEAARGPIPQEVWNAVNEGFSLTAAYARFLRQAQQRTPAAVSFYSAAPVWSSATAQNPPASTGSMRSAGYAHGPKDPFLDGLEGDW